MNKYAFFAIVVVLAVIADLGTKTWAENNLATRSTKWEHSIERVVTAETAGRAPLDWVVAEFGDDPAREDTQYSAETLRVVDADGTRRRPGAEEKLEAGTTVEVRYRRIPVVDGFWQYVYVRNFGAAWGFLSDANESFRVPFFLVASIVALVLVMMIYRTLQPDQKVLMFALSLIVGGALGNFIDRIRYGYVVDFIDWYVVLESGEKHWPTFNIADVWLFIGVALMFLDSFFAKRTAEDGGETSGATKAEGAQAGTEPGVS